MKKKRILILGSTGQVGKSLLEAFKSDERFEVLGTSRVSHMDYNLIQFDPFKSNWKILGRVDVLINCIGQIKEDAENSFKKIHVGTTRKILENRKVIGHPRIIQVSALGADVHHPVSFLKTKGIADQILLENENTYVIRPSIICTSGTMLVRKFRLLKRMIRLMNYNVIVPKGFLESRIQPIMISDLIEVVKNLCINPETEKIIEVAGPERITFGALLNIATETFTRSVGIRSLNKKFVNVLVKYLISPLFPGLINFEQYQLLFSDNISEQGITEEILRRKPVSTHDFWKSELQ